MFHSTQQARHRRTRGPRCKLGSGGSAGDPCFYGRCTLPPQRSSPPRSCARRRCHLAAPLPGSTTADATSPDPRSPRSRSRCARSCGSGRCPVIGDHRDPIAHGRQCRVNPDEGSCPHLPVAGCLRAPQQPLLDPSKRILPRAWCNRSSTTGIECLLSVSSALVRSMTCIQTSASHNPARDSNSERSAWPLPVASRESRRLLPLAVGRPGQRGLAGSAPDVEQARFARRTGLHYEFPCVP